MRLEGLHEKKSRFREIAHIQSFFMLMVNKLTEFRAYLPEAILGNSCEAIGYENSQELETSPRTDAKQLNSGRQRSAYAGTTSEAESSDGAESVGVGSAHSHSSRKKDGGSSASDPKTSLQIPSSRYRNHFSATKQVGSLARRVTSVLQVDISAFHTLFDHEMTLVAVHSEIMHSVSQVVQTTFGMCNPITGDKIMAFWNVRVIKSDHPTLCVSAALQIQELINQVQIKWADVSVVRVRMACTTGPACFGTMGTVKARAFTVIAASISRGFLFQKLAKVLPIGVVCDSAIYEHARFHFHFRLMALLPCPNIAAATHERIYEAVMPHAKEKADEWMYELQAQESEQAKDADFVLGVRALFGTSSNESSARQYFNTHLQKHPNDTSAKWYSDHLSDISHLMHERWGFMMPISMLYGSVNTTAPSSAVMSSSAKSG
jgi:class 3 adenylate cyclase